MPIEQTLRLAIRCTGKVRDLIQPLVALTTRLVIGSAFLTAGRGKLANLESTIGFFTSLGIPAPELNAYFIAGLEVAGGLALMVGLGTRVFALLLSATMIVALVTAHAGDVASALTVGGNGSLTEIVAFVYLLFLGWLASFGPGAVSVDRLLVRTLWARAIGSAALDGGAAALSRGSASIA